MKRLLSIASTLMATAMVSTSSMAADADPKALAGIWKLTEKSLVAKGEMYISLMDGGLCTEAMKVVIVGTTHWAFARCSWKVTQSDLTITITASPDKPEMIGKASKSVITSVSNEMLLIVNEKGKKQTLDRVEALPAEFVAESERAYASQKKK